MRVGFQRLLQRRHERRELGRPFASLIPGLRPWGAFSHFLIVLRDRLVSLAISLIDFPSRKCIPRILPIKAMVITSTPCHKIGQVRSFTLVNFQPASPSKTGQFSAGVNKAVCRSNVST